MKQKIRSTSNRDKKLEKREDEGMNDEKMTLANQQPRLEQDY